MASGVHPSRRKSSKVRKPDQRDTALATVETRQNLDKITNLYRTSTRTRLFRHYMQKGIHTDADLDFFIREYLHLELSHTAICPSHVAPFRFVADLFFERALSVFGFASRGSGKTQNLALTNFLDCVFKGVEVCNAGATLDQSGKAYEYFQNCWKDPLVLENILVQRTVQSETVLANGGSMHVTSGTPKGLNGPHPNKSRIDEVELIDWWVLQEGLSMSQTVTNPKGRWKGQDCWTSTRKFSAGSVQRILDEAQDRQISVMSWCLDGDTVIHSPSGDFKIKEAVGERKWVYSCDKNGALRVALSAPIVKTGTHQKLVKIHYEWGTRHKKTASLTCTPDHELMLRDGSFKQARHITKGDSLMPLYRKETDHKERWQKFVMVGFAGHDAVKEHQLVWEQLHGPYDRATQVLHHKNENGFDNDPSNLSLRKRDTHSRHHRLNQIQKLGSKGLAKIGHTISQSKTGVAQPWMTQENKKRWDKDGVLRKLHHANPAAFSGKRTNHQVTLVEDAGYGDVYDFTVPEFHNFAANHIFVHNCLWEVIENCPHDCFHFNETHQGDLLYRDTVVCPLHSKMNKEGKLEPFCGGIAHRSQGFIPIEEVIRKTKILDKGTLDAQWLCKKPSDATSVYGEYLNESFHEITAKQFTEQFSPEQIAKMEAWGGIDFGSNHCSLIGLLDRQTNPPTWYIVSEHYTVEDLLNKDHVDRITNLPYFRNKIVFYADYAQKQDIREFNNLARGRFAVVEADKEVFAGIETVKQFLQRQLDGRSRLYIVKDLCPVTCKQMGTYSHKINAQTGLVDRDQIYKVDDHCPDAVRYMIHSWRTQRRRTKGHLIRI